MENLEEHLKRNKRIYLLIFAEDLGKNSLKHLKLLIEENGLKNIQVFTKRELGIAFGKAQVGIVFFTNNNIAGSVMKKIDIMQGNKI